MLELLELQTFKQATKELVRAWIVGHRSGCAQSETGTLSDITSHPSLRPRLHDLRRHVRDVSP